MKRFLKKRWHGIPIGIITAILVVCLLAGGALAYTVMTWTAEVEVLEPLEVTEIQAPGTSADTGLEEPVYAGGEIGLQSPNENGGKYFIRNISGRPITVTITVTESNGQMAWYGFKGFYATTGYKTSTHDADTYNWDDPICNSTGPVDQVRTCTFELGTKDYVYADLIAQGMTRDQIVAHIADDSSCVKFFVDGIVSNSADPLIPLAFTVTVDR